MANPKSTDTGDGESYVLLDYTESQGWSRPSSKCLCLLLTPLKRLGTLDSKECKHSPLSKSLRLAYYGHQQTASGAYS